jgi:hypothetical protein
METIVIHLFCWSGLFAGYLVEDFLFDVNGVYLGWEDASGRLWRRDGNYLGERVDQHFVMRRDGFATPVPLPRRVPPVIPNLPAPPANRAARPPRPGWTDALAAIVSRPATDDLIGVWHNPNDRIVLNRDGTYRLVSGNQPPQHGTWMLRGNLILTPASPAEDSAANLVFHVIEYDGMSLSLRYVSISERSIPFTLHRVPPDADPEST